MERVDENSTDSPAALGTDDDLDDEVSLAELETARSVAEPAMINAGTWKARRDWREALIPFLIEQKRTGTHEPNDVFRNVVIFMSAMGLTQEVMCLVLQISEGTLRKYYHDELKIGSAMVNLEVASTLADIAVDPSNKSGAAAAMWWLERRGGVNWKPPQKDIKIDQTTHEERPVIDLSALSYDERQQFKDLLLKLEVPKLEQDDE